MHLDRTFIAIRERGLFDTLDLSLQVCRLHAWPLLGALALGAVPFALLNYLLTDWILPGDLDLAAAEEVSAVVLRFAWTMLLLVTLEAPLAAVCVTAYLGQAMFLEAPRLREVVGDLGRCLPQVFWCQLVGRGVFLGLLLAVLIPRDSLYSGQEVFLALLCLAALVRRLTAPFLNEILVLEKAPLRAGRTLTVTAGQRSRLLHGAGAGSIMNLGLVAAVVAALLTLSAFGASLCLRGMLLENWSWDVPLFRVGVPLSLWLTVLFLSVARFLAYLDLRIRHEGWEVELRMRAEGIRLAEEGP